MSGLDLFSFSSSVKRTEILECIVCGKQGSVYALVASYFSSHDGVHTNTEYLVECDCLMGKEPKRRRCEKTEKQAITVWNRRNRHNLPALVDFYV